MNLNVYLVFCHGKFHTHTAVYMYILHERQKAKKSSHDEEKTEPKRSVARSRDRGVDTVEKI